MIGFLTGKIISKKPTQILLDVNGVGYSVNISITTFEKLGEENSTASLYTFLSVKEDALDLYGFSTEAEKEMFRLLISVSGIGPKLAQSILSGIQIEELKEALQVGNISRLVAIPGIGRKTAERMLIELRDKVEKLAEEFIEVTNAKFAIKNDAVSALTSLGYNTKTAEKSVRDILEKTPDASIEDLVKQALSILNK
ncbi:MAG: Holliday junction branch migration protein RuvA [Ignavibacteriae bacterium]|jgi:Holliday junction DNA helicase RuvA|nr:Holliday junction branch migration protein RuvA [Ignavibacteriota bacterium]NOG98060.1 Holliday junction branch migration protein RuvA [Ignavibacteriota bacterium]